VFFVCYVGNGLCDELITRLEESYGGCVCLIVCDQETPARRWRRPKFGYYAKKKMLSVPLSAWNSLAPMGRIFMKFDI
jgi:hypothetical protein